jgi:hypothetical protein
MGRAEEYRKRAEAAEEQANKERDLKRERDLLDIALVNVRELAEHRAGAGSPPSGAT